MQLKTTSHFKPYLGLKGVVRLKCAMLVFRGHAGRSVTRWQQRIIKHAAEAWRCDPSVNTVDATDKMPCLQSVFSLFVALSSCYTHVLIVLFFVSSCAHGPFIAKNFCGSILADCFVLTPHNNQLRHCQRNTHRSRIQPDLLLSLLPSLL